MLPCTFWMSRGTAPTGGEHVFECYYASEPTCTVSVGFCSHRAPSIVKVTSPLRPVVDSRGTGIAGALEREALQLAVALDVQGRQCLWLLLNAGGGVRADDAGDSKGRAQRV